MLIYITHPYTAATPALTHVNVIKAIDLGLQVFAKGHTPFIPVLNHYIDLRAAEKGIKITYEDFMRLDFDVLERCDALLYNGTSPGSDRELEFWLYKRLPSSIREGYTYTYYDIDEVPEADARE